MPQKQTGPTKRLHTLLSVHSQRDKMLCKLSAKQSRVQSSLFSQENMVVLMHLAHITPNPAFSLLQGKCVANISKMLTEVRSVRQQNQHP